MSQLRIETQESLIDQQFLLPELVEDLGPALILFSTVVLTLALGIMTVLMFVWDL